MKGKYKLNQFWPQNSPLVVAAKGLATLLPHTMTKRGTLLVENNYEARIVNSSTTSNAIFWKSKCGTKLRTTMRLGYTNTSQPQPRNFRNKELPTDPGHIVNCGTLGGGITITTEGKERERTLLGRCRWLAEASESLTVTLDGRTPQQRRHRRNVIQHQN